MECKSLAILLAIYDPKEDWLIELLDSLNQQTYQNLTLYVRDDASPNYSFSRLQEIVSERITKFPFHIFRNEVNVGSNKTFAALLQDAKEEAYIAFCDQDDIWLPKKLENSVRLFEESPLSPTLVCTNVSVIDGSGKEIAASITDHRKRHIFQRGQNLAPDLIHHNFVMGCTILMERARALSYLPFPESTVHDHYLAFRAATDGAIDYLSEAQMRYRIYGGNQTGVMTGVHTKEDYLMRRILVFGDRINCFSSAYSHEDLERSTQWYDARLRNYHREKGGFQALWKMRHVNYSTSMFELFGLRFPNFLFRFAIKMITKGKL